MGDPAENTGFAYAQRRSRRVSGSMQTYLMVDSHCTIATMNATAMLQTTNFEYFMLGLVHTKQSGRRRRNNERKNGKHHKEIFAFASA